MCSLIQLVWFPVRLDRSQLADADDVVGRHPVHGVTVDVQLVREAVVVTQLLDLVNVGDNVRVEDPHVGESGRIVFSLLGGAGLLLP